MSRRKVLLSCAVSVIALAGLVSVVGIALGPLQGGLDEDSGEREAKEQQENGRKVGGGDIGNQADADAPGQQTVGEVGGGRDDEQPAKPKRPGSTDDVDEIAELERGIAGTDSDIEFYGRVLDEEGNGVDDANVAIQIRHYDPGNRESFMTVRRITISTDQDGRFEIRGQSGRTLFVKGIEKPGYAPTASTFAERGFDFRKGSALRPKVDRDQPVAFVMRRRVKAEPLKVISFQKSLEPINTPMAVDLETSVIKLGNAPEGSPSEGSRIRFLASMPDAEGNVRIELGVVNPGDGVIVDETPLYVAPEDGYAGIGSFTVKRPTEIGDRQSAKRHLYFRKGAGQSYARIELEVGLSWIGADQLVLSVMGRGYRNPRASRVLEYDKEVNREELRRVRQEWEEAAKKAE